MILYAEILAIFIDMGAAWRCRFSATNFFRSEVLSSKTGFTVLKKKLKKNHWILHISHVWVCDYRIFSISQIPAK